VSDKFITPDQIIAGTTSVSLYFTLLTTTTSAATTGKVAADMTLSYWRQGGTRTAIAASDLAAVNSAYSAGGVKEVDAANMPGLYRWDIPDAAFATGADWVVLSNKVAGCIPVNMPIAIPTLATYRTTLLAKIVEDQGSITLQQALSIILSATAGVSSGGGTTRKTPNGSVTRISATIDGSNNRTAITLTPSAGA
jgi:hypothetical protein